MNALKLGVPVVQSAFITACVQEGKIVGEIKVKKSDIRPNPTPIDTQPYVITPKSKPDLQSSLSTQPGNEVTIIFRDHQA